MKEVDDIIVSKKDRYGFDIPQILCSKCGLIRSGRVFDEKSNIEFYKNEYRPIYVGKNTVPKDFFNDQKKRGIKFKNLFKKYCKYSKGMSIFEIGCGAGGVLLPRKEESYLCGGCDFNQEYLDYGINEGLQLEYGDYNNLLKKESVDIVLLSHVIEHFLDPINEIQKIINKVKKGGYLIVEVPGIFSIHKIYFNPLLYFQNAHVFNYYYYYLKVFFEKLGLIVVYGDERCTFILQKQNNYNYNKHIEYIYDKSLNSYSKKISKYLTKCKKNMYLNPFFYADKILKPLGLYYIFSKFYNKLGGK